MDRAGRLKALLVGIPRYLELLVKLLRDPRVSSADKSLLAAAVAYTLTPIDLIPDFLPLLGQLDDLFFLALAIDRLVAHSGVELVLEHWGGSEESLAVLCGSLEDLAGRLPEAVRGRLRRGVEGR